MHVSNFIPPVKKAKQTRGKGVVAWMVGAPVIILPKIWDNLQTKFIMLKRYRNISRLEAKGEKNYSSQYLKIISPCTCGTTFPTTHGEALVIALLRIRPLFLLPNCCVLLACHWNPFTVFILIIVVTLHAENVVIKLGRCLHSTTIFLNFVSDYFH